MRPVAAIAASFAAWAIVAAIAAADDGLALHLDGRGGEATWPLPPWEPGQGGRALLQEEAGGEETAGGTPGEAGEAPASALSEIPLGEVPPVRFAAYAVSKGAEGAISEGTQKQMSYCLLSARRLHPQPNFRAIILTDTKTQIPILEALGEWVELRRYDVPPPPQRGAFMLQRMELEARYLLEMGAEQQPPNVAFVDTDLLFVRPLKQMWEDTFEVALTMRPHNNDPINLGLKMVHREHLAKGAALWGAVVKEMKDKYGETGEKLCFWCDQKSFTKVVTGRMNPKIGRRTWRNQIKEAQEFTLTADVEPEGGPAVSLAIKLLTCLEYNSIPGGKATRGCLPQHGFTRVVHFKGSLKGTMLPFWEAVQTEDSAKMQELVGAASDDAAAFKAKEKARRSEIHAKRRAAQQEKKEGGGGGGGEQEGGEEEEGEGLKKRGRVRLGGRGRRSNKGEEEGGEEGGEEEKRPRGRRGGRGRRSKGSDEEGGEEGGEEDGEEEKKRPRGRRGGRGRRSKGGDEESGEEEGGGLEGGRGRGRERRPRGRRGRRDKDAEEGGGEEEGGGGDDAPPVKPKRPRRVRGRRGSGVAGTYGRSSEELNEIAREAAHAASQIQDGSFMSGREAAEKDAADTREEKKKQRKKRLKGNFFTMRPAKLESLGMSPEEIARRQMKYEAGLLPSQTGPFRDGPFDDTCVARNHQPSPRPEGVTKAGVVVVFCRDTPRWLRQLDCTDTTYYLYNKCASRTSAVTLGDVANIAKCTFLYQGRQRSKVSIPQVKHHTEYLHHVITHYDRLEDHTVFLKGLLKQERGGPVQVEHVPAVLLTRNHTMGYQQIGRNEPVTLPTGQPGRAKMRLNIKGVPHIDGGMFYDEMCAMWNRFTCSKEKCSAVGKAYFNPHTLFVASRDRLRSLPKSEYEWFQQYMLDVTGKQGAKRRMVAERTWPMMLGCRADLNPDDHNRPLTSLGGCDEGDYFRQGTAVHPPRVAFSEREGVSAEDPTAFVLFHSVRGEGLASGEASMVVNSALMWHPTSPLILLTDAEEGDDVSEGLGADVEYFEALTIYRFSEWAAEGSITIPEAAKGDLGYLQLAMESEMLRRFAASPPTGGARHLFLIDSQLMSLQNMTGVLQFTDRAAAAFIYRDAALPVDAGLRMVHKDRYKEAGVLWGDMLASRAASLEGSALAPAISPDFAMANTQSLLGRQNALSYAATAALSKHCGLTPFVPAEGGGGGLERGKSGEWHTGVGRAEVDCGALGRVVLLPCQDWGARIGHPTYNCLVHKLSVALHITNDIIRRRRAGLQLAYKEMHGQGTGRAAAIIMSKEHKLFLKKGIEGAGAKGKFVRGGDKKAHVVTDFKMPELSAADVAGLENVVER